MKTKPLSPPRYPATAAALRAAAPVGRIAPLGGGEVHVWRACLDKPVPVVPPLQTLLSADERERARKFFFERDRRRFIVGRGILRTLLGSYLGRSPEAIAFRYGANGKPALAAEAGEPPLFFNVAHSDDLALFAFTCAGEVGIDIERMRELADWRSIAELSFPPEELERLRCCPAHRRREEFFHAWTRQEAILKATGTGLPGARAGRSSSANHAGEPPANQGFHITSLEFDPGFAAALAVRLPGPIPDLS